MNNFWSSILFYIIKKIFCTSLLILLITKFDILLSFSKFFFTKNCFL
ncbi:hypothetical protein [Spiroplasma endosymbiont of Amphimallon solstitiale]